MRALLLFLGLAVAGCAEGSDPAPDPVRDAGVDATRPAPAPQAPFGDVDRTCDPVTPPSICLDYHAHNPYPWPDGGLVQYFILCDAGFINWDNCTAWSYDPYYYSTDTWAYCCFPPDAGPAIR